MDINSMQSRGQLRLKCQFCSHLLKVFGYLNGKVFINGNIKSGDSVLNGRLKPFMVMAVRTRTWPLAQSFKQPFKSVIATLLFPLLLIGVPSFFSFKGHQASHVLELKVVSLSC